MAIGATTNGMIPMSARAFALSLGVRPNRIRRAIKRGKLAAGVAVDAAGRATVVDPDAARAAWAVIARQEAKPPMRTGETVAATLVGSRVALYDAQRQRIEHALAERSKDLVSTREVERWYAGRIVSARTRLLGVPSRLRQRYPDLEPSVLAEVDRLIRESLEEVAAEGARGPEAGEPAAEEARG